MPLPVQAALVQLVRFSPANFGAKQGEEFWAPARYVAIVISPASAGPALVDLGPAEAIERSVAALREHVLAVRKKGRP